MIGRETILRHSPRDVDNSVLATAGGFAAIVLWSTTVAFARSLSEQLGPLTGAAAVYGVSAVPAVVSLLRSSPRRRGIVGLPARYLIGCGTLFVGYMLLLFLAVGWAEGPTTFQLQRRVLAS